MTGAFGHEQEQFRSSCRRFFDAEVVPNVEEWERRELVPLGELLPELHRRGLLGRRFPAASGGQERSLADHAVFAEELGRVPSGSVGMAVTIHQDMVTPLVAQYARPELKAKVLADSVAGRVVLAHAVSETGAGSDLSRIETRLSPKSDGTYTLTGQKAFVSLASQADYFCVLARGSTSRPAPLDMTLVLVPRRTTGVTVSRRIRTLGHRAMDVCHVDLADVRVEKSWVLGAEGMGLMLQARQFIEERVISAFRTTAMAAQMLRVTEGYCKSRQTFGQSLSAHQAIRHRLAKWKARVTLSRCLNLEALARLLDNRPVEQQSAMSKLVSCRLVRQLADDAVQLQGASAYLEGHPTGRFFRDARLLPISTGSEEIMLHTIAALVGC